jgi:hypothetical protein
MTLSDLILKKGQILISQIIIENIYLDGSAFLYGNVEIANDLSDMYDIDDKVMFNPSNATRFSIDDTLYHLTTEDQVYSTFINITPP